MTDRDTGRIIVVGVDGSENSAKALRWAVDDARRDDGVVRVVLAWSYLDQPHLAGEPSFRPDFDGDAALEILTHLTEEAVGPMPGATLELTPVNDLPGPALVSAAEGADLMVVGSRGLGGVKRLLLGSVSQHCLAHSPVPVVVIRP